MTHLEEAIRDAYSRVPTAELETMLAALETTPAPAGVAAAAAQQAAKASLRAAIEERFGSPYPAIHFIRR